MDKIKAFRKQLKLFWLFCSAFLFLYLLNDIYCILIKFDNLIIGTHPYCFLFAATYRNSHAALQLPKNFSILSKIASHICGILHMKCVTSFWFLRQDEAFRNSLSQWLYFMVKLRMIYAIIFNNFNHHGVVIISLPYKWRLYLSSDWYALIGYIICLWLHKTIQ